MLKRKIIGSVNFFICLSLIYLLALIFQMSFQYEVFKSEINSLPLLIITIFLLFLHTLIAFKLLFNKTDKIPTYLYFALTFCPIFYLTLFFLGYYLATSIMFQILFLILVIIIYYSYKNYSKKLALSLSLFALFVMALSFMSGFEESYCWKKGSETDITGSKMVTATKEDEEILKNFGVGKVGSKVGVQFITHIRCKKDFDFVKAIKDNYSILK